MLVRRYRNLSKQLRLQCDGREVRIPPGAESIVILNINSYAGGCALWNQKVFNEAEESASLLPCGLIQRRVAPLLESAALVLGSPSGAWRPSTPDDTVLEVVAIYGALHLGQIQLGLSRAVPLAQARWITLETNSTLPMQVDGEPWRQRPCRLEIQMYKKVRWSGAVTQLQHLTAQQVAIMCPSQSFR
jgi:diacylglycerol kinase (ATP)